MDAYFSRILQSLVDLAPIIESIPRSYLTQQPDVVRSRAFTIATIDRDSDVLGSLTESSERASER